MRKVRHLATRARYSLSGHSDGLNEHLHNNQLQIKKTANAVASASLMDQAKVVLEKSRYPEESSDSSPGRLQSLAQHTFASKARWRSRRSCPTPAPPTQKHRRAPGELLARSFTYAFIRAQTPLWLKSFLYRVGLSYQYWNLFESYQGDGY